MSFQLKQEGRGGVGTLTDAYRVDVRRQYAVGIGNGG
jgi:hypothetical protein